MIRKHSTLLTIVLAGLLAVVIGLVRGGKKADESIEVFQARRLSWGPEFDIVLAGDSRVNQGISPAEMRKILPEMRIANFGFGHVAFSGKYLTAVEKLLDPDGERRSIVLGIAPLVFTRLGIEKNEFLENQRKHPVETREQLIFKEFLHFFRPIEFHERGVLRVRGRLDRIQEFHPDGWAAATMKPEKPRISLDFYRGHYRSYKVADEIVEELIAAVRHWHNEGITVFGFMMPTSIPMIELDAELSGFDEISFVKQFTAAGGIWLTFNAARYHSYDGNHLRKDSARKFSRNLASKLKRKMKKGRPARTAAP